MTHSQRVARAEKAVSAARVAQWRAALRHAFCGRCQQALLDPRSKKESCPGCRVARLMLRTSQGRR